MTQGSPAAPTARPQRTYGQRIVGALKLDSSVYDEIEHDPTALGQAAGVIALAALAEGLGSATQSGLTGAVGGIFSGFIGWLISTGIIWLIGVRLMSHTADFPELLRTLGFASAPKFLLVLGVLPLGPLRGLLFLGVSILTLVAFVIAVRQALDVTTGRAIGVCALAVAVSMLLAFVLGGVLAA